ncbi:hypothetical protein P4C99_22290 [Pontiellaceae bacterium B1224]|nr:hypothetical protein [Pontiellaceae bacterium B1224]
MEKQIRTNPLLAQCERKEIPIIGNKCSSTENKIAEPVGGAYGGRRLLVK